MTNADNMERRQMERLTIPKDTVTSVGNDVIYDITGGRHGGRWTGTGRFKRLMADNLLLILTCLGIILGFVIGFGVQNLSLSKDTLMWIGMPGELFLRMLKLMILPLIVSSVISSTASLDPKTNGKISAVAFIFIVSTNVIACVVAVILCVIINPGEGEGTSASGDQVDREAMQTQDIFADLLRNMLPDNMVEATFRKARTRYKEEEKEVSHNATIAINNNSSISVVDTVVTMSRYNSKADGINVLGLVVICMVMGIAINKVKDKAAIFLNFFSGATEISIVIIRWFFWLTPVGVASLVAVSVGGVASLESTFSLLGKLVLAVTVGILVHSFLILPAILFVTTGRNPFLYILSVARPAMIGFASTSTAVAIPEMLDACERKNKIDSRISRFVIPFCVTLNADGSGLYITSAAIFIVQYTGVELRVSDVIVIVVLTAVASMAIPSVPSASIVTLVIILSSLNIPANDIALLFAVEWFLDRIRTSCNVFSHTFCAAVTYRFCFNELQHADDVETEGVVWDDTASRGVATADTGTKGVAKDDRITRGVVVEDGTSAV